MKRSAIAFFALIICGLSIASIALMPTSALAGGDGTGGGSGGPVDTTGGGSGVDSGD